MIVVSDATLLISLLKINQLNLLEKLFGNVKIPEGVYEELTVNPLYQEEAEHIKHSSFIEIIEVKDTKSISIFRKATGLDKGESEAIVLAEEIHADLLLVDERKARQVAKKMGITIAGTLGVLLSAYEADMLTSEKVIGCLHNMKTSGRRISDVLYNELIGKVLGK